MNNTKKWKQRTKKKTEKKTIIRKKRRLHNIKIGAGCLPRNRTTLVSIGFENYPIKIQNPNHNDLISDGSSIGIEIELCIDKKHYDKVTEIHNVIEGEMYEHIVYSYDATCECANNYSSAEIISPILKSTQEIEQFFTTLYSPLDKKNSKIHILNQESIIDGDRCGVHIHWRNKRLYKMFFPMGMDTNDREKKMYFFLYHIVRFFNNNYDFVTGYNFSERLPKNKYLSNKLNLFDQNLQKVFNSYRNGENLIENPDINDRLDSLLNYPVNIVKISKS